MYSKGSINTSAEALYAGRRENTVLAPEIQEIQIYKKERRRAKNEGLSHLYQKDYKPAVYRKAVEYRDSMSYKKKLANGTYKQIELFQDTNELKVFGLGPYLFIEYQRRIVWLFFLFSILEGIRLYINSQSTGMQNYSQSFGSYLIKTTIGNYAGDVLTGYDLYIMSIIPCLVYFIFFIFYLCWKVHYNSCISEEDENLDFIKPEKFCVEVDGFEESDHVKEEDLEDFFATFGPIYEVSLAREYSGKLKYFEDLDNLEEEIKEEELEIILGSGDQQNLKSLKKQKEQLSKYINTLKIKPSVRSAYIHYQFQKSKVDMLYYYSNHYLFHQKLSHGCMNSLCCCCIDYPEHKYLYKGHKLFVKTEKPPEPEDINWDSYEVSCCSKIFRIIFAGAIILLFLALSCTIIGLCSIYISSHSINCSSYTIPKTVAEAEATITTEIEKKCFCNANLISSFSNNQIKIYCGIILTEIYTEQGIQYAITATSAIVNFLFGLIVDKLVNMTQPLSYANGCLWKTAIYTLFIVFNTVFLPLLIYADIFGFKATDYVSFITIISTDVRKFFEVDSISLYVDYQTIWYRNVSPIFTNYIIVDTILTWVFFLYFKCVSNKQSLENDEGTILQKTMNEKITSWKLDAYGEYSYFNLIIFVAIFFECGVPVMIPLGFASLFSKYITNRSLLQNNSTRIQGLSESFNSFPFTMIPIMLILSCLFGEWMLSGNQALTESTPMKINVGVDNYLLSRQLIFPFYIILALVVLFQFLFYNTIVRFCSWLAGCCYDKKAVVHPYYTKEYSHYAKSMSLLHSYNIRNNIKYKNAIINLEKYLDLHEDKI